ncbi:hypothetical protein [Natrononativus amylolyticus]|nr:hypothetical protein [Natrononativus amylolyticus]
MGTHPDYVEDDVDTETRIEAHLEDALEACENDQGKYHIREALGLIRL